MPLYLVPALGSREDDKGIYPELPDTTQDWVGHYDEDSHQYVINTSEPIEDLEELEPGTDVGFDYSSLIATQGQGAPLPENTGAAAGEPPMDTEPLAPTPPVEQDPDFIDAD